jgi:hypothetical protein
MESEKRKGADRMENKNSEDGEDSKPVKIIESFLGDIAGFHL